MNAKQSIYALLQGIFNGEFYPGRHPDADNEKLGDFGTYKVIGGPSFNTLGGSGGIAQPRIQINIYSLNSDRRDELMQYVQQAMDIANDAASAAIDLGNDPYNTPGAQLNQSIGYPIDDYEDDTKRFVGIVEYYLWEKQV